VQEGDIASGEGLATANGGSSVDYEDVLQATEREAAAMAAHAHSAGTRFTLIVHQGVEYWIVVPRRALNVPHYNELV
jgi:hypothetical protein